MTYAHFEEVIHYPIVSNTSIPKDIRKECRFHARYLQKKKKSKLIGKCF